MQRCFYQKYFDTGIYEELLKRHPVPTTKNMRYGAIPRSILQNNWSEAWSPAYEERNQNGALPATIINNKWELAYHYWKIVCTILFAANME